MNVNQRVWSILREDFGILKDIERGIINVRALATYIITKNGLDATTDAVVSAIRRFEIEQEFLATDKRLVKLFKHAQITTKNGLFCLSIHGSCLKDSRDSFRSLINGKSSTLRMVTGTDQCKIIFDHEHVDKIKQLFSKDQIIEFKDALAEISIILDAAAAKTKGVVAKMTNELAINDINIEELIVCQPEYIIYVSEPDLLKSHKILMQLSEQ